MKFRPDSEYQKHRDVFGGVWFVQDGQRFSISGKHLGRAKPTDSKADLEALVKEGKKARKEAKKRTKDKLKEFAPNEQGTLSPIAEALKENREAEAAEANA